MRLSSHTGSSLALCYREDSTGTPRRHTSPLTGVELDPLEVGGALGLGEGDVARGRDGELVGVVAEALNMGSVIRMQLDGKVLSQPE